MPQNIADAVNESPLATSSLADPETTLSIARLLKDKYPSLAQSPRMEKAISKVLERLFLEEEIRKFLSRYGHYKGVDFAEKVLEWFDFKVTVSDRERENILPEGAVVVSSNHPLGSLDALALISMVASVRSDIKIVANDVLMQIRPLRSILLPVDNMGGNTARQQLKNIRSHLREGGCLIVFPAGEVSRLRPVGVRDLKWNAGFVRLASMVKAPIVPVHISARNSMLFYGVSALYKPASTLLLIREMFKQRGKTAHIRVGTAIDYETYSDIEGGHPAKARSIRKHLYRIGRGKPGLLQSQQVPVAGPEDAKELKRAMAKLECLGRTDDDLHIYLYKHDSSCPVMREIGRLRELTFRSVGEGTGERRDIDRFDHHYEHIILWNDDQLEIVGAYRLARSGPTVASLGIQGLYTSTLFRFDGRFSETLEHGVELGRSFVQPKYWGRRSLHYLWVGIGAYLAKYPEIRYLFGGVSLSSELPLVARDLIIDFYQRHFGDDKGGVRHNTPYKVDAGVRTTAGVSYEEPKNYKADFRVMRGALREFGLSVPTLYRQYSELCDPGGVRFLDFGVDPDFANCVDGFVVVDVHKMTQEKRARYIGIHQERELDKSSDAGNDKSGLTSSSSPSL